MPSLCDAYATSVSAYDPIKGQTLGPRRFAPHTCSHAAAHAGYDHHPASRLQAWAPPWSFPGSGFKTRTQLARRALVPVALGAQDPSAISGAARGTETSEDRSPGRRD
jgi:hypothetical protein